MRIRIFRIACCLSLPALASGAFNIAKPTAAQLRQINYVAQTPGENNKMWCVGLNAAGFDLDAKAGRNGNYLVPSKTAIKYFHDRGSNCFRLPISWERMQLWLGQPALDLVAGYDDIVQYITGLGDFVIIDPHNNDQGLQYNGNDATLQDFKKLWKYIAKQWKDNPLCIFGLYNEPRFGKVNNIAGYFDPDTLDANGHQIEHWRNWMQETLNVVRDEGAKNLALVPGLHWTSCRDWDGGGWWGEPIDGLVAGGNTRLAAINDSAMAVAYDVHQYMDDKVTGVATGCGGHDLINKQYSPGADGGLTWAINWAKKYNKKFMMTEIGSYPEAGSEAVCKTKMQNYIQRMEDSGVFIGYQVWQFGCPTCDADQWTLKPYNYDWYGVTTYGLPPGQGMGTVTTTNATSTTSCTTSTNSTSTSTTQSTTTTTTYIFSCPLVLLVEGAEAAQPDRMGTFTQITTATRDNRPIYENGKGQYLYYWSATQWQIGSDYLESNSGVQAVDGKDAPCPVTAIHYPTAAGFQAAPTIWQVATNKGWSTSYNVAVNDVAVISVTQVPNGTLADLAYRPAANSAALVLLLSCLHIFRPAY